MQRPVGYLEEGENSPIIGHSTLKRKNNTGLRKDEENELMTKS
jgi:hypothetical protein